MAQRRMFSPEIVESEEFLTMPVSSQALYFHLGMNADDDGFIQPKLIMRIIGANEDDIKVLLAKRFLLPFESGVVVIKHWLIHNMIRQDRYKPTRFQEELKSLKIKENKAYTEKKELGCQNDNQPATQVRLGKVRLGKVTSKCVSEAQAPTPAEQMMEFINSSEKQLTVIQALVAKGLDEQLVTDELKKFLNYWTELSRSGKKQRWEMEKTFELQRRLATWFSNASKFTKSASKSFVTTNPNV